MFPQARQIVLASTSPRRAELLSRAGIQFTAADSGYEEDPSIHCPPEMLAVQYALGKAEAAAKRYPRAVVIAADTVVVLGALALGKPGSAEKAKEMLGMLSGSTHKVITGYAVIDSASAERRMGSAETVVHFKKLSAQEIDEYVKSGEPLDKAGGYAIQGKGRAFIERYEGDYESVVGLPVTQVIEALQSLGVLA